jgi:hypothetical protein
MPFKSKRQQRFMFATKPKGVDLKEWSDSTDFDKLPEKKAELPDVKHPPEVKATGKPRKPMKPRMNALPHQERSADKLEDTQSQGLLAYHGIGSGKTFNSINAAKRMNLPIMAIVPAALRNNYHKEMEAAGNPVPHKVYSYQEAVNRLKDQKFLSEAQRSLVVMDEAHRIGQVESQRSQLANLPAAKKMLLTATPIRNHPSEIAPLVNSLNPGSVPMEPSEFNKRFIESREIPVGFWGRLMGAKPGIEHHAKNMGEFSRAIKGSVDHFENLDRKDYPSFSETIHEVPMAPKQQAAYDYMLGKYPALAYKVPSDNEEKNFTAFFSGPRMVSNHPGAYNASATDADAPKFHKAADELEKKWKADRNFRGVVYSNFLGAGIHPMERILSARGIPYQSFTGGLTDKERAKLVKDYNEGRNPVLLLSGAGAEGLDLKGTKLMQLMEPHWNEELMDQVRGRAIRYKSHSHLPEEERHVEVQRFHAVPQRGFIGRWTAKSPHGRGVDQYLYEVAKRKRELNQPFLDALQEEGQKEASVLHIEFVDDEEKTAGAFSWASRIPKMMAPKTYPKPPPREKDDGRLDSNGEIPLTPAEHDEAMSYFADTTGLPPAKPGKSLMARLFPGQHQSRFDYSAEIANHARELTARTGVAHHPDGSVNFEHPRVKGIMDLVNQGKLQIPDQHMVGNNGSADEYGIWHWAASVADRSKSKTQKLINPALLPSMGSVKTRPALPQGAPGSAANGPTVTGTSVAPTPG